MVWTSSIDRHGFNGGLGSIEIESILILVSGGEGFGGKSKVDWGQILRLSIIGDFIFDWRKVISRFMFLAFLAWLFVAHIMERLWGSWRTKKRTWRSLAGNSSLWLAED